MYILQFWPFFDLCFREKWCSDDDHAYFQFCLQCGFCRTIRLWGEKEFSFFVAQFFLSCGTVFFSCGTVFFLWHSFNFGCFIRHISAISVQNQNMVWRKNILTGCTNLRESCNLIYKLWKNVHLNILSDLCICRCSKSKNCVGNNIKWREKEKSAKPMFCGKSKFVVFPLGGRSVRECRRWVCAIC